MQAFRKLPAGAGFALKWLLPKTGEVAARRLRGSGERLFGALAPNRPLQDRLYLAFAERLGATPTTAGEKFPGKARPSRDSVRPLDED